MISCTPLATHPDFIAFCEHWQRDRRCPLPFSDWLRDHGYDAQADAAFVAATKPDVQVWSERGANGDVDLTNFAGHFPHCFTCKPQYRWYIRYCGKLVLHNDDILWNPKLHRHGKHMSILFDTFVDAIVFYLDYQNEVGVAK
jgi:hypothetical protein